MTEDEIIQHGKAVFEECYRGVVPMPATITPTNYAGLSMKMFHDFWGALPELSMREKRMVVIGTTIMASQDKMFAIHAECAMRNGEMDAETLRSVVKMALPYVGFPAASTCLLALEPLIARLRAEGVDVGGGSPVGPVDTAK